MAVAERITRVSPVGDLTSPIILVYGKPDAYTMSGKVNSRADNEMDRLLRSAGIDRSKCYITYACKQNISITGTSEGISPGMLKGIIELGNELKAVKQAGGGNIVIAIGEYALWALTGETGIMHWRGSVIPSNLVPGVKVLATLAPDYLVRGSMHHSPFVAWDLQKAKRESAYPDIRRPQREYVIADKTTDLGSIVQRLTNAPIITCDTEWYSPSSMACIGFTDSDKWAVCIPCDVFGADAAFRAILSAPNTKVFQNAMFDVVNLRRIGYEINGRVEDTMIAFHYTWPDLKKKDLGTINSIYTDEPYYKEELKIWGNIPGEEGKRVLWTYNCKDNASTHESWFGIQQDMIDFHTRKSYDLSMSIFPIMAEATHIGIRADKEKIQELRQYYASEAEKAQSAIFGIVGEFNTRSPKQVASVLYDVLGMKRPIKISTDIHTLMDLVGTTSDPINRAVVAGIVKSREYLNYDSRYLHDTVVDSDGRIRCSWNIAGTKNGRLSASKTYNGSGFSLQTAPEEIRSILVADEGCTFIGWDLAQAEAFVVAYLCEDDTLIEDMRTGVDIHVKLAAQLPFGKTYEEIKALGKESRERMLSKKSRHGFNYRMGPFIFRQTVNKEFLETGIFISTSEARALHDVYHQINPNLRLWYKEIETHLKRGWMENCFGRRRQFLGQWGDELIRDATAFEPQSTVSDVTTQGIVRAKQMAPWCTPLIHMHDGGFIQVPLDRADEMVQIVLEAMTVPVTVKGETFEIPVEVSRGDSWHSLKKVARRG